MLTSNFLFVVCQVGSEWALKDELKHNHTELRPAFSRPGFVTFKSNQELRPDFTLKSVFARAYSLSLGKAHSSAELLCDYEKTFTNSRCSTLHVFERDLHAPDDEPRDFTPHLLAQKLEAEIRSKAPKAFEKETLAHPGFLVFDIVVVEPDEFWYGVHLHSPQHSAHAGGNPRASLPKEAPSRAWLKIVEAQERFHIEFNPGQRVLELGCAPGGASHFLLSQGLNVYGIDPGAMAPICLADKHFHHIQKAVGDVALETLPSDFHWIVSDLNISPRLALNALRPIAKRFSSKLHGAVLTIKLNEERFYAEVPKVLKELESLFRLKVHATQLPSNRREICVYLSKN